MKWNRERIRSKLINRSEASTSSSSSSSSRTHGTNELRLLPAVRPYVCVGASVEFFQCVGVRRTLASEETAAAQFHEKNSLICKVFCFWLDTLHILHSFPPCTHQIRVRDQAAKLEQLKGQRPVLGELLSESRKCVFKLASPHTRTNKSSQRER